MCYKHSIIISSADILEKTVQFSLFMEKNTLFKANISQRQHLELAGSGRLLQQGALGSIKPRADPLVAELFVSLGVAQRTS